MSTFLLSYVEIVQNLIVQRFADGKTAAIYAYERLPGDRRPRAREWRDRRRQQRRFHSKPRSECESNAWFRGICPAELVKDEQNRRRGHVPITGQDVA